MEMAYIQAENLKHNSIMPSFSIIERHFTAILYGIYNPNSLLTDVRISLIDIASAVSEKYNT